MSSNFPLKHTPLFVFLLLPFFLPAQKKKLAQLNSTARETNLSISPNGKYLYFMSDRGGREWSKFRRNDKTTGVPQYDGDLWYSVNVDGAWQPPVCLDASVNTSDGEDEPNITADGQRVYFQSWKDNWPFTGGPYYMASLKGTVWENPVGLGDEITRFFKELSERTSIDRTKRLKKANLYEEYLRLRHLENEAWKDSLAPKGFKYPDFHIATDGMSVSPDEKIFIVSAYMPETAQYDLFISRKNEEGIWSYPKPLNINTDKEEKSVFIAGDNQTIYFASSRDGGFGGLDVYKTSLQDNNLCTPPENLGRAFNTAKDDASLILDASGKSGFMVSDGDIYAVSLDIPPPKVLVINGLVIDEDNNPVAADIDLIQVETRRTMGKSKSNARTGEYSFSLLRKEGKYRLIARAPERRTIDSLFEVTPKSKDVLDFVLIMKTPQKARPVVIASLDKDDLRKGEIFRIDKLQFDANSAVIKETFYPLLDQMAEVLSRRDKLRIEIGGHTNINPEHDFCDRLSEARALAVYNYLRQKGVPEKNLMYKGYGKRNPIAPDTEYGRQLNQRVEIKVL